jgi:hypothetical protein
MNTQDIRHALNSPHWAFLWKLRDQTLLPKESPPEGFVAFLEHHRLVPLYHHRAAQNPVVDQTAPWFQQLKTRSQLYQRRALEQTAALLEIQKMFDTQGIHCIVLKGVTLSQQLYQSMGMRQSRDIDVWVAGEAIASVHDILITLGYQSPYKYPLTPAQFVFAQAHLKDIEYYHPITEMIIEVHWRFELNPHWLSLAFEHAWQTRQTVTLGGITLYTLSPTHNLLYLCLHGAKHVWARAQWIEDIAHLLQHTPVDWLPLIAMAKKLNVLNALLTGVFLAHGFTNTPCPSVLATLQKKSLLKGALGTLNGARRYNNLFYRRFYLLQLTHSILQTITTFRTHRAYYSSMWLRKNWNVRWFWMWPFLEIINGVGRIGNTLKILLRAKSS